MWQNLVDPQVLSQLTILDENILHRSGSKIRVIGTKKTHMAAFVP